MAANSDQIQLEEMTKSNEGGASGSVDCQACIFTLDKQGMSMLVEGARDRTSDEYMAQALEELGIPLEKKSVFSMWLRSPFLEVQLKPQHSPFVMTQLWKEFLIKYALDMSDTEFKLDEPVLALQRNVFRRRQEDLQERHPEVLAQLYNDAKLNVVRGRYPCDVDLLYELAGLQACICERYDEHRHTAHYYKSRLDEYLPPHLQSRRRFSLSSANSPEQLLASAHQRVARQSSGRSKGSLIETYLSKCIELPFYGAAFFRGQIETPGRMRHSDTKVFVAINRDGLFIIDEHKPTLLLGLSHGEFEWDTATQRNSSGLPVLFIQYNPPVAEGEAKTSRQDVLQVFTRQELLIDAMIESCQTLNLEDQTSKSSADPLQLDQQTRSLSPPKAEESLCRTLSRNREGSLSNKFKRLCVTSFNSDGHCVSSTLRR